MPKTNDPQITVDAHLKEGEVSDLLIFSIPLGFFELVCIANIPGENETASKVYVKFKVRHHRNSARPNQDVPDGGSEPQLGNPE